INSVSADALIKVNGLASVMVALASVGVGTLPTYVQQLGILTTNMILARDNSIRTAEAQSVVLNAFNNVIGATARYNSAISTAGADVNITFSQMASVVGFVTGYIIKQ